MFLKAAINGIKTKEDHPKIPVTVDEIVKEAEEVIKTGACAIHFHVRDSEGKESLHPDDLKRNIKAFRFNLPDVPVGISTGDWIVPDKNERIFLIKKWQFLPDFVSINFDEDGAEEIAEIMAEKGIGVEAGISNRLAVEKFSLSKFRNKCIRILIEPEENIPEDAIKTVKLIEDFLDESKIKTARLLHGFNEASWFLLKESFRKNYQSRIGLEDTFKLPDGRIAKNNRELIEEAVKIYKMVKNNHKVSDLK